MVSYRAVLAAFAAASLSSAAMAAPPDAQAKLTPTSDLDGLKYRLVGPFRGGRATGVAGVPGDPTTFYFGAAAGGLWKTTDAGTTWKPLWDNFPEAAPAVGAVAVARSNPNVVYAGTGEANIRGNVLTGNGLYKSTDAGKTWAFAGLRDTQVIGRIIIDPKDPNTVFVAALGHTVRRQRRARRVPDHRRGRDLEEGPLRRPEDGRLGRGVRPHQPEGALRGDVAGLSQAVDHGERRARLAASTSRSTAGRPGPGSAGAACRRASTAG